MARYRLLRQPLDRVTVHVSVRPEDAPEIIGDREVAGLVIQFDAEVFPPGADWRTPVDQLLDLIDGRVEVTTTTALEIERRGLETEDQT